MKTKTWLCLIGAILVLSLGLSIWILRPKAAATHAQITSDGVFYKTIDLTQDGSFRVERDGGYNILTVSGGKIAVTEADCPDGYCKRQGFCNAGVQIVCLPHGLVISFLGETEIDGAVG